VRGEELGFGGFPGGGQCPIHSGSVPGEYFVLAAGCVHSHNEPPFQSQAAELGLGATAGFVQQCFSILGLQPLSQ